MLRIINLFTCLCLISLTARGELTNNPVLGAGAEIQPAYDGSRNEVITPIPLIRYFGPHFFVRDTQEILETGIRDELLPHLYLGSQMAYEPGRLTYQSNLLEHYQINGLPPGASWGGHLEWDTAIGPMPLNLLLRDRQRLGSLKGNLVDLRLSAGILSYRGLGLALFTQSTWANQSYNQSMYGVTAMNRQRTGLPLYQPGSGLIFNSLGLMGGYNIDSHWAIFGSIETRRLSALVVDSPLVDAGSARYLNLSLVYQFP